MSLPECDSDSVGVIDRDVLGVSVPRVVLALTLVLHDALTLLDPLTDFDGASTDGDGESDAVRDARFAFRRAIVELRPIVVVRVASTVPDGVGTRLPVGDSVVVLVTSSDAVTVPVSSSVSDIVNVAVVVLVGSFDSEIVLDSVIVTVSDSENDFVIQQLGWYVFVHVHSCGRTTSGTSAGSKKPSAIGYTLMNEQFDAIDVIDAFPFAECTMIGTCRYVNRIHTTFRADAPPARFRNATIACDCQIATESDRTNVSVTAPWKSMKLSVVVENSMHCTVIVLVATDPLGSACTIAPRISASHAGYPFGSVLHDSALLVYGIFDSRIVALVSFVGPCRSTISIRCVCAATTL